MKTLQGSFYNLCYSIPQTEVKPAMRQEVNRNNLYSFVATSLISSKKNYVCSIKTLFHEFLGCKLDVRTV